MRTDFIDYDAIRAKPTTYKNWRYKSKLEAAWAAFFDLLGWDFEYEPVALGDWIPDFIIRGKGGNTLVEVKPLVAPDEKIMRRMLMSRRFSGRGEDSLVLCGDGLLCHYEIGEERLRLAFGWMVMAGGSEHDDCADRLSVDFGCYVNAEKALMGVWRKHGESQEEACEFVAERLAGDLLLRPPGSPLIGFCSEYGDYLDAITGEHDEVPGVSTHAINSIIINAWCKANRLVNRSIACLASIGTDYRDHRARPMSEDALWNTWRHASRDGKEELLNKVIY